MTKIVVKELVFDEWSLGHIQKHRITSGEIIEAGKNLIYHRATYKSRYLAIGRSGKRMITLILRREKPGSYYLVTARDSSKKEREKIYEKEKQNP